MPAPAAGRTGWPWLPAPHNDSEPLPVDFPWPRITIVTATLNQGQFIEETIRSVLLQGYPNLEYIIIDGGSTDGTLEIVERYLPWLDYFESAPDRGQSHAINKGFGRATGDILGWLNSDDLYLPEAMFRAGLRFAREGCDILSGNTIYLEAGQRGSVKRPKQPSTAEMLRTYLSPVPQPSTLWRRDCWERYGPLDEELNYRMDYALFLCFSASDFKWVITNDDLAWFRRHDAQKTWSWEDERFHEEKRAAIDRFAEFDGFGETYSKDIERALWHEGWLVSWMATHHIAGSGLKGALKLLAAPVENVRMLWLADYYRRMLQSWIRALPVG